MSIREAAESIKNFLEGELQKKGDIIRLDKTDDGWEAELQIIEESEYIKALGIPTTVYDKNQYIVKLDQNLEVIGFNRREEKSTFQESA